MIENWGGGGVSAWVKNLSKISFEAFLDEGRSDKELSELANAFAFNTVELISNPPPFYEADNLEINFVGTDPASDAYDDFNILINYANESGVGDSVQEVADPTGNGFTLIIDLDTTEEGEATAGQIATLINNAGLTNFSATATFDEAILTAENYPGGTELSMSGLDIDYLEGSDDLTLEDKLATGKNYSPSKTHILQQLSVGISQGFFGFNDFNDEEAGLTNEDFIVFLKPDSIPNSVNEGNIEENIITGFFDGLLDATLNLGETKEVFLYESVKAAANGFMIASTVAATSKVEYIDKAMHLDTAEMIAKQVSQSVMLHRLEDIDGELSYSMGKDWIEADRIAESAASGSAMGSQLATVLPKSLDYLESWEISTNIRREIAKSVSRGSASGSVNAAAWLGSIINPEQPTKTILSNNDIEKVSNGTSVGSMIGNTGLAIYYPTDQLVPIINLTAQGSAYGSTNAQNLSLVESDSIETIDVGVARQSALGSSLASILNPQFF